MQAQHSAISKLNDRIRQVLAYLQAIKGGQAPWDHQALRQIQTVVANLPQTVLPELQEELLRVSTEQRQSSTERHAIGEMMASRPLRSGRDPAAITIVLECPFG